MQTSGNSTECTERVGAEWQTRAKCPVLLQYLHLADAARQFCAFARCPAEPQRKHVRTDGAEAEGFDEVRALNLALGRCRPEAGVACTACTGEGLLVAIDFASSCVAIVIVVSSVNLDSTNNLS